MDNALKLLHNRALFHFHFPIIFTRTIIPELEIFFALYYSDTDTNLSKLVSKIKWNIAIFYYGTPPTLFEKSRCEEWIVEEDKIIHWTLMRIISPNIDKTDNHNHIPYCYAHRQRRIIHQCIMLNRVYFGSRIKCWCKDAPVGISFQVSRNRRIL